MPLTPPRTSREFSRIRQILQTNDKDDENVKKITMRKENLPVKRIFKKKSTVSPPVELINLDQVYDTKGNGVSNYFSERRTARAPKINKNKRQRLDSSFLTNDTRALFEGCQLFVRMAIFLDRVSTKQHLVFDPVVDIADKPSELLHLTEASKFICKPRSLIMEVIYLNNLLVKFDVADVVKVWILKERGIHEQNILSCLKKSSCFSICFQLKEPRINRHKGKKFRFSKIVLLLNTTVFEFETILPFEIWKHHATVINMYPSSLKEILIHAYHEETRAYSQMHDQSSHHSESKVSCVPDSSSPPSEERRRSKRIHLQHKRRLSDATAAELLCYYPPGTQKIKITRGDFERLEEEVFLNDTLISFYLQYILDNMIFNQDLKSSSYLFSTFFWEQLIKPVEGAPKNQPYHKRVATNFVNVKKWLLRLKLFSKNVVIIPFNQSLHWSVGILCNLDVIDSDDPEAKRSVFIYCDSLPTKFGKRCFRTIIQLLKHILLEEKKVSEDAANDVLTRVAFVSPNLPSQLNSYDCGIYLLTYAEIILNMIQLDKIKFTEDSISSNLSKDLNENLFDNKIIAFKRCKLKKKIKALKRQYEKTLRKSRDVSSFASDSDSDNAIEEISKEEYYADLLPSD